jgi:hypothetical protein
MSEYLFQPSQEDGTSRASQKSGKPATRTLTVTIRLDPRLKYFAELGSRKQRRTLSSFIEWAIEHSLDSVHISRSWNPESESFYSESISDIGDSLWDVFEADRFAKLAFKCPDLLDHTEQIIWKLVQENGLLWRGHHDKITGRWTWSIDQSKLIFGRLREYWDVFNRVARGEAPTSELPEWVIYKSQKAGDSKPPEPPPMDDEDIPF